MTAIIQELFELVSENVQQMLPVSRFYAALHDPVKDEVEFPFVVEDGKLVEWHSRPYASDVLLPDQVIRDKAPIMFEQDADAVTNAMKARYWPADELPLSCLGVPLMIRDRAIGALVIENRHTFQAFGEKGQRLLVNIARQVAIAAESISLAERLERKVRDLQTINKMAQRLTSSTLPSESEILNWVHNQTSQLIDATNIYIALYDETTHTVSFPTASENDNPIRVPPQSDSGRIEWIIFNRMPILLTTWIGVPMLIGEKVLGVIVACHTQKGHSYDEEDLELLSLTANQAATALDRVRLDERVKGLEVVQSQIANTEDTLMIPFLTRYLEHRINNLAGTIPIRAKLAKEQLQERSERDSKVANYLNHIAQDATALLRAAEELESVATSEYIDMEELIGSIVGQFMMNVSPDIDIVLEREPNLPDVRANSLQLEVAFYCVIHNAVKSISRKGQISIRLGYDTSQEGCKTSVRVDITDTGCGIPLEQQSSVFDYGTTYWTDGVGTGYGLWRARNIFRSIGGEIRLARSSPGVGSTFSVVLPATEVKTE